MSSRRTFLGTAGGALVILVSRPALGLTMAEVPQDQERVRLHHYGRQYVLELDSRTTLLDALREHRGLTGTKKGCDQGQCGACTILVNGQRIHSRLALAVMHDGDEITTIEGLAKDGTLIECRLRSCITTRSSAGTVLPARFARPWPCWMSTSSGGPATSLPMSRPRRR